MTKSKLTRMQIIAKRVASDISMNPYISDKKIEDALEAVKEMWKVFGIPNPPGILLDAIVDACAMAMICKAFQSKYQLGSMENIRMDCFQSSLPQI